MSTDQIYATIECLNRALDNPVLPIDTVDRILSQLESMYAMIEGY